MSKNALSGAKPKVAIGIDLGTTYSCVAVWKNGKAQTVANANGTRTTSSCVAFTDVEILSGASALRKAAKNAKNTVFDVKRVIGRSFDDPVVAEYAKQFPCRVLSKDDDDSKSVVFEVQHLNETKQYSPEFVMAQTLQHMRETAEAFLGQPSPHCVISVPSSFSDAQRRATIAAAELAGLKVMRLISEPCAAVLAYGLGDEAAKRIDSKQQDDSKKEEEEEEVSKTRHAVIFDLGGAAVTVTVMAVENGLYRTVSTASDPHVGGEDFDERLVQHFAKQFSRKYRGMDMMQSTRSVLRLRSACERAKHTLSSSVKASVELDSLYEGMDLFAQVTRARFEMMCQDLFNRCAPVMDKALADAGIDRAQVDDVVMAGGCSRIPFVQTMVSRYFGGQANVLSSVKPDEVVAVGAAVQANLMLDIDLGGLTDELVQESLAHSIGLQLPSGAVVPVLRRGSALPCSTMRLCTTSTDNQRAVQLDVVESVVDDDGASKVRPLAQLVLADIADASAGVPQVEVTFSVDRSGILSVTAVDKARPDSAVSVTLNKPQ